ncbi:hypothetical protein GGI35DRAFT_460788 [Trichoderma velutinum]
MVLFTLDFICHFDPNCILASVSGLKLVARSTRSESIHPWYMRYGRRAIWTGFVKTPELDPRRVAAYRYPKASWRRMIPCMPPPIELQVSYEYRTLAKTRLYTLRCLKFSNETPPNKAESVLQDSVDGELRLPWLTFGLLHDIVEGGWFRGIPTPVGSARFDYSFQETRPYIWKQSGILGQASQPTPEELTTIRRYGRREKLRDILPEKKIGGPGRILVLLTGGERRKNLKKKFRGQFEVDKRIIEQLKWDEEIDYKLGPIS